MIPIYLRARPNTQGRSNPWLELHNSTSVRRGTDEHSFQKVFAPRATQQEVYEECVQPLVARVLCNINATFFTLGATGSGKSHTIFGSPQDPGVAFRAINDILERKGDSEVKISMIEIYKDQIYDLLEESRIRRPLTLKSHSLSQGCGLDTNKTVITSVEAARACLEKGYATRSVSATNCNSHSSRSHALVFIEVGRAVMTVGDLAGSERVNDAGSSTKQREEAGAINRSLMQLGQSLQALQNGGSPIKGSKLSSLLLHNARESQPVMLVTMDCTANEKSGVQILRYASTARQIKQLPSPKKCDSALSEKRLRESLYAEMDARLARLAKGVWA